uniref:RNA polymerase II subunit B1 CTD phosphatase RPAP2 homolog n=1 Tax=Trichuris muris TaxID=70415 RepID=A0A5S6R1R4_TRIMR
MVEKAQSLPRALMSSVPKGKLEVYERKRFEVMEALTSPVLDKQTVIEMCQYIDSSSFHSVAEERYLNGVCGYVLCSNSSPPKRMLPTYSLRGNRILLNKERVWFCSRVCNERHCYLAVQIPEEPFWARTKTEQWSLEFLESSDKSPARFSRRGVQADLSDLTSALSAISLDKNSSGTHANEELEPDVDSSDRDCEQLSNGDIENATCAEVAEENRSSQKNASTAESAVCSLASTSHVAPLTNGEHLESIRARYFEKAGSRLKMKTKAPALIDPKPLPISVSASVSAGGVKLTQTEFEDTCRMVQQWFKGIKLNWAAGGKRRQTVISSQEAVKQIRLTCAADLHDDKRLRRSIFYAGVSKSLPLLCQGIGLELAGVYKDDLKFIISALQLEPGNVVLKPAQWLLTAHFLFSIISFKRPELMQAMESEKGQAFCDQLLSSTDCASDAYRKMAGEPTDRQRSLTRYETIGYLLITFAVFFFAYYTCWVILLPFFDPDQPVWKLFPPHVYAFAVPSTVIGVIIAVAVAAACISRSQCKHLSVEPEDISDWSPVRKAAVVGDGRWRVASCSLEKSDSSDSE